MDTTKADFFFRLLITYYYFFLFLSNFFYFSFFLSYFHLGCHGVLLELVLLLHGVFFWMGGNKPRLMF